MLKLTRIAAVALIALALLLAVVAFLVSRRAAPTVVAAPQVAGQPQQWPVVEAAGELPAGRPISAADLRIGSAPQAPQGGYASIAEATGAVPVHTIAAGTVLNSALMARGYALRLNPGERALAVPVDELVAAGNRILPGDYVDVFLNLRAPQGMGTEGQAQARLLLSRMRVLSYGAADTAPGQAAPTDTAGEASTDARAQDIQGSASSTSSTSTSAPVRSAVLAVPVAEANRLLLGAQQGRLFLALRNPADVGQPDQELFAQPGGVLDARRELSPEQRLALQSPENDAYAGIDSDALAGRSTRSPARSPAPVRASAPRQAPRLDRGVEIIRGDVSSHSGSR
ncbi:Flp pilus assembly protein CpaB [Stenotrophomonas rhizophila]|uniref:Flp pilus assembly protein CpaB n=1 Tax=Stenotrophomonas rhizophila TaxID=216778 RepID=UPI002A6A45E3|nr:Flp pilus assembly protein CpaB [Stenotrophomonas rhizophila]MDY0955781.1 Flp pilus assembly protein CpaB [Stenotrophomonas rhizophila]